VTVRKKRLLGVSKVSLLAYDLVVVAPNPFDSFNPFDFLNFDTFDLWRSSPVNSGTYGRRVWRGLCPYWRCEQKQC
jgi:hypothetical protein